MDCEIHVLVAIVAFGLLAGVTIPFAGHLGMSIQNQAINQCLATTWVTVENATVGWFIPNPAFNGVYNQTFVELKSSANHQVGSRFIGYYSVCFFEPKNYCDCSRANKTEMYYSALLTDDSMVICLYLGSLIYAFTILGVTINHFVRSKKTQADYTDI